MTELTIILNFIIIFLLITAIVYGFVLNKRISLIRNSGRELAHLFRSFDDTILKAQTSVDDLKKISGVVSEGLQKKIDKAALLTEELMFLDERASKSADNIRDMISNIKKMESMVPVEIGIRGGNTNAKPLIFSPQMPEKSMVPTKPSLQSLKKRALEDLLEEASANDAGKSRKPLGVNNNTKDAKVSAPNKSVAEDKNDKRQFSIASALKALGYGD